MTEQGTPTQVDVAAIRAELERALALLPTESTPTPEGLRPPMQAVASALLLLTPGGLDASTSAAARRLQVNLERADSFWEQDALDLALLLRRAPEASRLVARERELEAQVQALEREVVALHEVAARNADSIEQAANDAACGEHSLRCSMLAAVGLLRNPASGARTPRQLMEVAFILARNTLVFCSEAERLTRAEHHRERTDFNRWAESARGWAQSSVGWLQDVLARWPADPAPASSPAQQG